MVLYYDGDVDKRLWPIVGFKNLFPKIFKSIVVTLLNIKCDKQRKEKWQGDFSKVPLFQQIEIETVNICNNDCSFCPVSRGNDIRIHKKMEVALFDKILCELGALNYDGIISLFSNNEPLIDERIVEFARKTREIVPHARINIYSNGILLTEEIFEELVRYVDNFQIDNYSDEMMIQKHLNFVIEACRRDSDINRKVNICVMKKNQIRSSRGGNAPNKREGLQTLKCRCILPLHEMTIRPDGKVSLCCNDAYGEITLGDINEQGLVEVWESDKYREMRKQIFDSRANVSICKYCDSVDFGRDKFWSKI